MDTFTLEQRKRLDEFVDIAFKEVGDQLGCIYLVEHVIRTESPLNQEPHHPLSPNFQKIVDEELNDMLIKDIVETSTSPWSTPVVIARSSEVEIDDFALTTNVSVLLVFLTRTYFNI